MKRLFVAVLLSAPLFAQSHAAWEWTLEERINARLVAADRTHRVDRWSEVTGGKTKAWPHDYIEGATSPELLLPTEIVDDFIDAAFVSEGESAAMLRSTAANTAVEKLGLPPEFFPALEKAFAGAVAAQKELRRIMESLDGGQQAPSRIQRVQQDACRARAKGIETLRAAYGKGFDRFLYEVVAPNVTKTIYEPQTGDALRRAARGCP